MSQASTVGMFFANEVWKLCKQSPCPLFAWLANKGKSTVAFFTIMTGDMYVVGVMMVTTECSHDPLLLIVTNQLR